MKRQSFFLSGLAAACLPLAAWAAQDTWVNNGTIATPPTIDATNVINNGIMGTFYTILPFDTSNTKNFTNAGTMTAAVGFRFDTAPRNSSGQLTGLRVPAANFHNRNTGIISAYDYSTVGGFVGSIFTVEATNLVNQGILTVGAGGLMQLTGGNVNLSRGGFGVLSINDSAARRSYNYPLEGRFAPDVAITDDYWEQTNMTFNVANLLSPNGVVTPRHDVQTVGGGVGPAQFRLESFYYGAISNVVRTTTMSLTNIDGSFTNFQVPSNIVKQVAFVAVPYGSGEPSITFTPSSQFTNNYHSVYVTLRLPTTNTILGTPSETTVYLQDTLAGENDTGLLVNSTTTQAGQSIQPTYRPKAYIFSRVRQGVGISSGNVTNLTTDFFYDENYGTNIVESRYAAYSATMDNIVLRPPNIPAGTATNLTGRAEVRAANLDLTRARIRGEGLISLQTTHLLGSSNALVDCENLSLDLGSTNGLLQIKDITKTSTDRVRGTVYAWSATWSNTYSMVYTNYVIDEADTNAPPVAELVTNAPAILFHALVYDLSGLTTTIPVSVQQFKASATNIVMEDRANVVLEFLLKGQSFTLNGQMNLSGGVTDWRTTNAPTLRYFTNNGTLNIANEAHFGDDAPQNYLAFVNRGTISSFGQNIASVYAELGGTNISTSSFNLTAQDAKVESGRVNASGDVLLTANTLKFNRAVLQTSTRLVLNVPGTLQDNGPTSSNVFTIGDGMLLEQKPATGDLLGTTIRSVAPNFGLVSHYWAGTDRGATPAGYANNAALGRLTLTSNGIGTAYEFMGTDANNALYVDLLDLSQLTDLNEQLIIHPNITVYYAAAKLGFVPPGGVTPEEYLDHQFGDHLRWVSQYTGPNSSVDVIINGNQTIKVNRALRDSTTIDSDSDGVPNYYDASPFDGVKITSIARSVSPAGIVLSWDAAPNTVYRVEYRTALDAATWLPLLQTTNAAAVTVPWSVLDTNGVSGAQRYYRVSYNPNGP